MPATSSGNCNAAVPTKGQKRPLSDTPSTMHSLQGPSGYTVVGSNMTNPPNCSPENTSGGHANTQNVLSRTDNDQRRAKAPRPLHGGSRASPQPRNDGKTLHSIEYITHMPSPTIDHVSLPPLKSGCSSESMIDPASSPTMKRPSLDMIALGDTTVNNNGGSISKYPKDVDREIKHDITYDGPAPMTLMALHSQPTHYISHTTTTTNPILLSGLSPPVQIPYAPPAQFRPATTSPITSTSTANIPTFLASTSTSASNSPSSPSLTSLESQLHQLRQYAEELLALSMHDSHRLLQQEIRRLEETLLLAKRERSERLIRRLEMEFPGLVGVREGVRREGARLGYF
ncbi:hypothetical protein PRK78_005169 [Emydomyces testavorans]|uniref:Uncharacterized protein n=1 Tax=Emydomyces testavorans TaxID=2070801 RepID=A0AAF0DJZ9_9EURO|nr:hypothetical protein PRK78_005169 [Emydomyces testavorans]